jgi:NAD(P)-dependent dehydrogenase (short-subunit alcohol dehydrogenase family)
VSILITGGSKGIGRGIALRFAEPGNLVFLNYAHDDDAAKEAADLVAEKGAEPILLKRDIGDADACAALLADVAEHTDRLDQLVHGAVAPITNPILDLSPADFDRAVNLNGSALLWLTQSARPLLGQGSTIFFLSSRGSKVAVPNYAAIGAPKAMAEAIIRYLAVELAPHGIRAHIVSASGVLTDAIRAVIPDAEERFAKLAATNPSGRNLEIEDIANAVAWLASEEASMVTGRELFVDGGLYTKAS